jgi:hypothetical protein
MSPKFLFIDATKTDAGTRRRARSHAMKGKNVGKRHNRRTKVLPPRARIRKLEATSSSDPDLQEDGRHTEDVLLPMPPALMNRPREDVATVPQPLWSNTTPQSQHAIRQCESLVRSRPKMTRDLHKVVFAEVTDALHHPRLCSSLEHINALWFSILFSNKTGMDTLLITQTARPLIHPCLPAYHCTMALMGTLTQFFFGRDAVPSDTVSHLTQAVILVNRSLDAPEALSDTNISVVNFMVVHELLNGAKLRALVHLKGLQKMVELRGGILALRPNLMLLVKICK